MLNQNDFRSLLTKSESESGNSDGDAKTRFDMKQISAWERENRKAGKGGGASFKGKHGKKKGGEEGEGEEEGTTKYRNRALERQKESNPDYNRGKQTIRK